MGCLVAAYKRGGEGRGDLLGDKVIVAGEGGGHVG